MNRPHRRKTSNQFKFCPGLHNVLWVVLVFVFFFVLIIFFTSLHFAALDKKYIASEFFFYVSRDWKNLGDEGSNG